MELTHSPSTQPRSFLSFPPIIRQQIYHDAGLISDCDIDFNRLLNPNQWPPPADFEISHDLLLTCRTIYSQASYILYSTNRFFIRYNDARSLKALRNLTTGSIALLTQLTVHLNATSCERRQACCEVYSEKHNSCLKHSRALGASSQDIISEWQSTAYHLLAHIKPSYLCLYFVCDVNELKTSIQILEPLGNIPALSNRSVPLAQQPDPLLRDMAQEVAIRTMGYQNYPDHTKSAFRFLDLPRELRIQILEYTDLITPLCEVEWNPESNFYLHHSRRRCGGPRILEDYPECPDDFHHACQFRNCWESGSSYICCFCRGYHAAFSAQCHSWAPPTSLFLVCKQLREDSQMVFFSTNRFVIVPSGGPTRLAKNTPAQLEISLFLRDVVPSQALRFLRSLEVVFPPFQNDYLCPYEPAYEDWLQTIEFVRELLYLPTLTLRVYMADYILHGERVVDFRRNITKQQGMTVLKMYIRTLWPLSKLRESGLRRFFVDVVGPFAHTRSARRNPASALEETMFLKQRIERLVMGDDYNSTLLCMKGLQPSQWRIESMADHMSA
ncbi:MAG: hypothetical protein M1818_005203 [Claussenomyces sp. TS43310]|nr:MAG: hypothetical protein M1818_005203 [Claussenomyces sp. TS43310]